MNRFKLATLTTITLLAASCAKPGSGSSGPSVANGSPAQAERQLGEGSPNCPFSADPATYSINVPDFTKALGAIPVGKYVLTEIRGERNTFTTIESAVFSNGFRVLLKEPGRIGTDDTTQVLIKDVGAPLTGGNLSFPLSLEAKTGGVVTWGRFATYEPKVTTGARLSIGTPVVKDFDEKILNENTGRYSFNVFARRRLSGYQAVVKLSGSDFGTIKGLLSIEGSSLRFVVSLPRGSNSTDVSETTYELIFKREAKATAPDCGAKGSAIKVLGSST
jgi:hypothetical protein